MPIILIVIIMIIIIIIIIITISLIITIIVTASFFCLTLSVSSSDLKQKNTFDSNFQLPKGRDNYTKRPLQEFVLPLSDHLTSGNIGSVGT